MLIKLVAGLHGDVLNNLPATKHTSSNLETDSLALNKGTSHRENNEDTFFSSAGTFQGGTKLTITPSGDSELSTTIFILFIFSQLKITNVHNCSLKRCQIVSSFSSLL